MNFRSFFAIGIVLLLLSVQADAQLRVRTTERSEPPPIGEKVRATPAYAELVLRRTELEATIEELLVTYNEGFSKVLDARFELGLIEADLGGFGVLNDSDAPRLTLALGKLMVRRAQLATEYWSLSNRFKDVHPAAKRAKRKFEIYDRAVKDLI